MKRTVLVVEEHPLLRRAYARVLCRAGYEAREVAPAEEIETVLAVARADAIVLDPDAHAGRGREIAQRALRVDSGIAIVFLLSSRVQGGADFSTWVADACVSRTQGPEGILSALRALLPPTDRKPAKTRATRPNPRPVSSRA